MISLWSYYNTSTPQLNFSFWFPGVTVTHDAHEEKMENGQISPDGFLSKSIPADLIDLAGSGILSNQLASLSKDLTGLSKGGLIHRPSSNAL